MVVWCRWWGRLGLSFRWLRWVGGGGGWVGGWGVGLGVVALVRVVVVRRPAGEFVVLVGVHHVVADDWSLGVLVRELVTVYGAFVQGRPSPLPVLPVQYGDFAV